MPSLIQHPGSSRGLFRTLTLTLTLLSTSLLLGGCGEEEEVTTADMGSGGGEGGSGGNAPVGDGSWNSACEGDENCMGESDYCVLNPMTPDEPGYCSRECRQESDCAGSELGWTCNVIGGCENPVVTWCGPPSEVDENPGVLTACP